jgi:hypothetical protein
MTKEQRRLDEARTREKSWKRWGPYLSERQWGTVREDYSEDGNAWNYFTHDQARSRAYRWGEDGLAGISDDHQVLCFALALWNGEDPILKERLFGLTNSEGNHGEDVKEYYFYLDSTPTHSYMKYLYKYPQAAYPYVDLIETNRHRGRQALEYELLDTGVFDEDRYFDVFVEYAKAGPDDLAIKISVANRGPEAATLHLLPTLWFRNTWSWVDGGVKPILAARHMEGVSVISAHHSEPVSHENFPDYKLYCEGEVPLLFTENETNKAKLFGEQNASAYVKDGINDFVVSGNAEAVNPAKLGTKAAPHYLLNISPGETRVVRLRLTRPIEGAPESPFKDFDELFAARLKEADEFYDSVTPAAVKADPDRAMVMRQALAGLLWSKQYFYYDLNRWLKEHNVGPWSSPEARKRVRNSEWFHMDNDDIISMPDKWEYPWRRGVWRADACLPPSMRRNYAASSRKCWTRTNSWVLTASARCHATTWTTPSFLVLAARSIASPICRATLTAECSAGTPTGGDRSGCRSTFCSTSPSCGWALITATPSRWNARPVRGTS